MKKDTTQEKDKDNNIKNSLELSIVDDNLKNIVRDFTELPIDELLTNFF